MPLLRTLIPLSVAALVAACATTATAPADEHGLHHPASGPSAMMEPRMKAMQEMHEKMLSAKTPEERQALMADHMKAMHDGMAMMKGMSGMGGGMGGMGMGGMANSKDAPADSPRRQHLMEQRMDMMQMMMEMMMDRLPPQPAPPAKK